jgi:hypothetical protein
MTTDIKPETPPDPRVDEEWIYIGRRDDGKTLNYHYLDPHGKELVYGRRITGNSVGARYAVKVDRSDPTKTRVTRDVYRYVGMSGPEANLTLWRSLDTAAETAIELRRSESRDKLAGLDDLTLGQLRIQYARMMPTRRRAFLATIIDQLTTKPPKTKPVDSD